MYQIPDHPMIRAIERTGYPEGYEDERLIGYCDICGKPIYEFDNYADEGVLICEDCEEEEDDNALV